MSRNTRQQVFRPNRRRNPTKQEIRDVVQREFKRRLKEMGLIQHTNGPKYAWKWDVDFLAVGGTVHANTRSEARALIKAELGIRNKTLPRCVTITKVGHATQSSSDGQDSGGAVSA